jgi:hypothetical protein
MILDLVCCAPVPRQAGIQTDLLLVMEVPKATQDVWVPQVGLDLNLSSQLVLYI